MCRLRSSGRGGDGLDVKDSGEQVLDNLSLALLPGRLDLLDLLLSLSVGLGLSLLVALAMLYG